ncbi:putative HTH-type transcriptional regulator YybR [Ktedonobacter sp. SOSP1-85]|uniref:winged helix-turn-helix transcriptional regulator n=1 Tax=Ktedonobacter sp. SOSP1-85 TaxID=2778367 RepID=UPI001A2DECE0|nr:helix-turn-helix domain-containing protein [Ktedonobacter sp. SOSP1-85]GHO79227.1 putative HTH-type transcriptional regulator YybR [Ktedonobacter sp. SOSP1-85]
MKKYCQQRVNKAYSCPVEATVDVIGGKWKSLIIYHLLAEKKRFGELQRLIPGVTLRMLTLQLRELEADGIIDRQVYRQVPPKVEYSLTSFGASLQPILQQMSKWGENYMHLLEENQQRS